MDNIFEEESEFNIPFNLDEYDDELPFVCSKEAVDVCTQPFTENDQPEEDEIQEEGVQEDDEILDVSNMQTKVNKSNEKRFHFRADHTKILIGALQETHADMAGHGQKLKAFDEVREIFL